MIPFLPLCHSHVILLHLGICLVACLASLFVNVICITWHDYYSQCSFLLHFHCSFLPPPFMQLAMSATLQNLLKQKINKKFAKYFTSIKKINSICQNKIHSHAEGTVWTQKKLFDVHFSFAHWIFYFFISQFFSIKFSALKSADIW